MMHEHRELTSKVDTRSSSSSWSSFSYDLNIVVYNGWRGGEAYCSDWRSCWQRAFVL